MLGERRGQYTVELSTRWAGAVVVVNVVGDLHVGNVGVLRKWLDELLASGEHNFVIDLHGVENMDGSGLATLVQLFNKAQMARGDVRICGLGPKLEHLFDRVGLDRIFEAFDQCDGAIASFGANGTA